MERPISSRITQNCRNQRKGDRSRKGYTQKCRNGSGEDLKDGVDVLGGVADPLGEELGAVDDLEGAAHREGDRLARHRLSGAGRTVEQNLEIRFE